MTEVPPGSIRAWILAARPATLTAAFAPVAVGTACAWRVGGFRWDAALAALLGAFLIQIATNFANGSRRRYAVFLSVIAFCLARPLFFFGFVTDLNGVVSIRIGRLDLKNWTRTCLNHCDGNLNGSIVQLSHAQFFA